VRERETTFLATFPLSDRSTLKVNPATQKTRTSASKSKSDMKIKEKKKKKGN